MSRPVAYGVAVAAMEGVVFADTAAQARWTAVASYRDAGYGKSKDWPPGVSAWRRPELDRATVPARKAFTEEFVLIHLEGK